MSNQAVRFIHISDTHLGSTPDFDLKGAHSLSRCQNLITILNNLPAPIDFVIHTGDVATDADKTGDDDESTRSAAATFSHLNHPLLVFNGNHDSLCHLHTHFGEIPGEPLDATPQTRAKTWTCRGERFVFLDARGCKDLDPAGELPAEQLQRLDVLVEESDEPLTVFLHYPPVPLDAWFDERLLIRNGEALHERLRRIGNRLRGVFFGHIHASLQVMRDGVFYCACGATSCQFRPWHGLVDDDRFAPTAPLFYNYVTLDNTGVIVKQFAS